jgi:N-hydroxyarylamine O-acetyltransferase
MDLDRYFDRIGFAGSRELTLDALNRFVWAHLHAVPFENLDIVPLGRSISLEPDDLYLKIVTNRRGGFCFELNGLAATMLQRWGFDVAMGYAQWTTDAGDYVPPFDHMVLVVAIPGRSTPALVDVGFGRESPARAVELLPGRPQRPRPLEIAYRFERRDDPDGQWTLWATSETGAWTKVYDLTLTPRALADYQPRCDFHQSSADSPFTRGSVCSLLAPGGRVTIADNRLILQLNGQREERELNGPDDVRSALMHWFGIELEAG